MELQLLDDKTVLNKISQSVKNEKKHTLEVLEYLAEVNRRRLHLQEGYSSLHDFCIRYLKYSEGEANRRVHASRALWKFEEEIKPALEKEEITLTGLCLLSKHLTQDNVIPLLAEVKNQSTRTIEKVIESHFTESKKAPKTLLIELDDELEALLEKAKSQLSEKLPIVILKKALKELTKEKRSHKSQVKRHTRYVQTHIKRDLKTAAQFRCSYKSASGVRCNQTAHLQIDHIRPYAMGGSSKDLDNLRVLCRAHNLYKARMDHPKYYQNTTNPLKQSSPKPTK